MPPRLAKVTTDAQAAILSGLLERCGLEGGSDPYFWGEPVYWLVQVDAETVGFTGLHSIDWVSRRCRGQLWIAPEHRRKGYGSEALDARNWLAFNELNMNRVEWVVPEDKFGRLDMAQKRGEHLEGRLREVAYYDGKYHDYLCYSLLRSDGPPQDDYQRSE